MEVAQTVLVDVCEPGSGRGCLEPRCSAPAEYVVRPDPADDLTFAYCRHDLRDRVAMYERRGRTVHYSKAATADGDWHGWRTTRSDGEPG